MCLSFKDIAYYRSIEELWWWNHNFWLRLNTVTRRHLQAAGASQSPETHWDEQKRVREEIGRYYLAWSIRLCRALAAGYRYWWARLLLRRQERGFCFLKYQY